MRNNTKFCAVIKADAYGLGAKVICRKIDDLVDYFAVSSEDEFLEIKKLVSKQILLLDPIYKNITKLARLNCEFCVSNEFQFNKIYKLAKINKNVTYKIHIAFNTGMNRFGFDKINDILNVFELCKKTQNITIIGVFSHFYMGNDQKNVNLQTKRFAKLQNVIMRKYCKEDIIFHISNTDGFEFNQHFTMVRIGLGMFLYDNNNAFSLESNIVEIRLIEKQENVGYSNAFIAPEKMKIAVISIGYADGVMRSISGKGFVLVNGKFCKILAVCMDSIIIDTSNVNCSLNDKVTLIGENGSEQIFICDFASWCDTINYEVMTRISKRVKRVYIGGQNANHNWKIQGKKTSSG